MAHAHNGIRSAERALFDRPFPTAGPPAMFNCQPRQPKLPRDDPRQVGHPISSPDKDVGPEFLHQAASVPPAQDRLSYDSPPKWESPDHKTGRIVKSFDFVVL